MSSTTAPWRASALAQEGGLALCLWKRELMRVARERARWIGALAQPLLFWLITGSGMARSFHVPGHEDVSALTYFFPGMLVMIILFTTIFGTISVVEDRQQGFLQSVLVAPGSRLALVCGKIAGVTTLVMVQLAFFLLLAPAAGFHAGEIRWVSLVLVSVVSAVGLTAMNFTAAWLLDSVQGYHAIMGVVLIPLWFLSGAMFPPPGGWLGAVMRLNPLTYATDGLRAALSPDSLGAPGASMPVVLAVLVIYSIVMISIATVACRRRADPRAKRRAAR
jgi:ABC-2 type transport system permease protein